MKYVRIERRGSGSKSQLIVIRQWHHWWSSGPTTGVSMPSPSVRARSSSGTKYVATVLFSLHPSYKYTSTKRKWFSSSLHVPVPETYAYSRRLLHCLITRQLGALPCPFPARIRPLRNGMWYARA
eukprot:Rmarinus@m.8839